MFKLKPMAYCIGVLCILSVCNLYADAKDTKNSGWIVKKALRHDTSLPLRFLKASPTANAKAVNIINDRLNATNLSNNSAELESSFVVPLRGFQGLGVGLGSYMPKFVRPDTNGSVGMLQYTQWVNPDMAVFDKATGQLAAGFPKPAAALWAGFGGVCESKATGFLTMKYDHLAHRWFFSQFAIEDPQIGPFYYCFAVSTSEDVTGSYHRYAFQLDSFSLFARGGLWPDAYYYAFNMIGRISDGPLACALDRKKMLNGEPANMICRQLTQQESPELLPADLEGETLPPEGNPEYFLGLVPPDQLIIYKLHVDFENPVASHISTVFLPVKDFTGACSGNNGNSCAVQPNTPNRLNIPIFNPMRVIYRNFDNYASMVLTHNIEGPQPKYTPAIRWYELRVLKATPAFNPIVFQEGTLAPDSKNRFMGSISIDKAGGIAVAYTVSTSLIYPSIEMAYRTALDPKNTLKIQPLVTGRGSQVNGISEWGAISKMAMDPVDNCTFWYTNEYLKTTGFLNWSTAIISFKLPGCV